MLVWPKISVVFAMRQEMVLAVEEWMYMDEDHEVNQGEWFGNILM